MSSEVCETIPYLGIVHTDSLPTEFPEYLGTNSDISVDAEQHLPQVAARDCEPLS